MEISKPFNILIVDDHPLNVDAYKNLIGHSLKNQTYTINESVTCEEACKLIDLKYTTQEKIDFAFIDYNLPEYHLKKIFNGLDLSQYLKSRFSECKIIFITMHNEPAVIVNILQSVAPEGLISKSDVSFDSFKEIINTILLNNNTYKSKSILKAENVIFKNNLDWDEYDFQILELINSGEKTIAIPKYIPLTLSAIEKRKSKIKKQLLLGKGNDKELIDEAKKRGLIY